MKLFVITEASFHGSDVIFSGLEGLSVISNELQAIINRFKF